MSAYDHIAGSEDRTVTVRLSARQLFFIKWLAGYHIRSGSNPDAITQSKALLVELELLPTDPSKKGELP